MTSIDENDINNLINLSSNALNQNGLSASNKKIKNIIIRFIKQCIEYFNLNPPFPPIIEINRRTILHVIDTIKNNNNNEEYPNEMAKHSVPIKLPPLKELPQMPLPHIETVEKDDNNEDTFYKKLEDLEISRNSLASTIAQNPVPVPPPIPITSQPIPQQQQQIISTPTVIYIPTKSKLSDLKQIIINSFDRDWTYIHKRSIFMWEGPIPVDNNIKLGFAGIFLPKIVATLTPVVLIEIEGAGGHKQHLACSLNTPGTIWDNWNVLRTPDSSDISLKNISCPWTIKLFDIYNNLLDLGNDSQIIKESGLLLSNNGYMETNELINDLEENNIFIVKKENVTYGKFKVIGKVDKRYQIQSLNDQKDYNLQDGLICNLYKQITMVIEITKNEINDK
jgi:hypothetical protein